MRGTSLGIYTALGSARFATLMQLPDIGCTVDTHLTDGVEPTVLGPFSVDRAARVQATLRRRLQRLLTKQDRWETDVISWASDLGSCVPNGESAVRVVTAYAAQQGYSRTPSIIGVQEREHCWLVGCDSGQMSEYGVVVDKRTQRCFTRPSHLLLALL